LNGTITGSWNVERGIVDINKCAEALTYLYQNKELGKQMGKNGRDKVVREYTWKTNVESWKSFLRSIE